MIQFAHSCTKTLYTSKSNQITKLFSEKTEVTSLYWKRSERYVQISKNYLSTVTKLLYYLWGYKSSSMVWTGWFCAHGVILFSHLNVSSSAGVIGRLGHSHTGGFGHTCWLPRSSGKRQGAVRGDSSGLPGVPRGKDGAGREEERITLSRLFVQCIFSDGLLTALRYFCKGSWKRSSETLSVQSGAFMDEGSER